MRLVVRIERLGRILKWVQRALFACAVLFLGYCGFALTDGWIFQRREGADLDRLLRNQRAVSQGTPKPESATSPEGAPAAATDGLIGRIQIPRLLLSAVVVEGIGKTTLRRAVGHIPGTALPGQPGNVGDRRTPGHILSSAEGFEDQRRDSILDVEWRFQDTWSSRSSSSIRITWGYSPRHRKTC